MDSYEARKAQAQQADDRLFKTPGDSVKRELCGACRRGEHVDHHSGVWARADGSDPAICPCDYCAPVDAVLTQQCVNWEERHD